MGLHTISYKINFSISKWNNRLFELEESLVITVFNFFILQVRELNPRKVARS